MQQVKLWENNSRKILTVCDKNVRGQMLLSHYRGKLKNMRSVQEIECGWVERDVLQHLVFPSSVGFGVDAHCRLVLLPFPQGEHCGELSCWISFCAALCDMT